MTRHLLLPIVLTMFLGCSGDNKKIGEYDSAKSTAVEQWLTFSGKKKMPTIVLVSGDEEYRSEEALPQLAKILATRHNFNCTVLFAQNPDQPGIVDPNYTSNIPGLYHLESADLMVIFTRFRALPDEQMKYIDDFLRAGKPVIGIRTATHAFMFREVEIESTFTHYGNFYDGNDQWNDGFGRLVLGEKWISHHGRHGHQSTRGFAEAAAVGHPILNSIAEGEIWGPSDVYGVRLPLPADAKPIVLGQVVDREGQFDENDALLGMRFTDNSPAGLETKKNADGEEVEINLNKPMMPIAWTKTYQLPGGTTGRAFTSTIGASTDMLAEGTRRMFVNAAYWLLDLEVPESANVDLVGKYIPTRFKFYDNVYWQERQLAVSDLR